VLRWALKQGCPCNDAVGSAAEASGHAAVMQWEAEEGYAPRDELTVPIHIHISHSAEGRCREN
jgi:hypothetical protein